MTIPIVFVHGLFGSLDLPQVEAGLAPHPVYAPDMPGYGTLRHAPPFVITLENQAAHLFDYLEAHELNRVHLLGHSVGGAIAVLFAHKHPQRVASLTLAEGNMTIDDAFWSAGIARRALPEVERLLDEMRADPVRWLYEAGCETTPANVAIAAQWLHRQPASTVLQVARATLWTTGEEGYLAKVRAVLDRQIPLHLLAGERSREAWHVPQWLVERAVSDRVVPGAGHLMMLDNPNGFADAIRRILGDTVAAEARLTPRCA